MTTETANWQWLEALKSHPRWNNPKGKWGRTVMSKFPDMTHDDLYAEVLSFIGWFKDSTKNMPLSFHGHLRRNDYRYKHKYRQHYPAKLMSSKAIEPLSYGGY